MPERLRLERGKATIAFVKKELDYDSPASIYNCTTFYECNRPCAECPMNLRDNGHGIPYTVGTDCALILLKNTVNFISERTKDIVE